MLIFTSFALRIELYEDDIEQKRTAEIQHSIEKHELRLVTEDEIELMIQGIIRINPMTLNKYNGPTDFNLTNYQDMQYYGPIQLGKNSKDFTVVYDTGSSWFWIPKYNWVGWPTTNKFDPTTSSTYSTDSSRQTLNYGKGSVEGYVSKDLTNLKGATPNFIKFLLVDIAQDLSGSKSDGIAGLAPTGYEGAQLLTDVLFNNGVINKNEFTVYIGKSGVDGSYINFGSIDSYENTTDLPLIPLKTGDPLYYWSTKLYKFYYGENEFSLLTYNTVWDTGTSILGMNTQNLGLFIKYVANGAQVYYISSGFYGFKWSGYGSIKDLYFKFSDKTIKVNKNEYIQYTQGLWIFLIFELSSQNNFMLLGDSFLRGIKTVHDIQNSRLRIFPQNVYSSSYFITVNF